MTVLKFRLNLDAEDVEIVLNDKVVDTVGTDVLNSWVDALNEKRKVDEPVETPPVKVDEPVVEEPAEEEKPEEE